jgi:LPLT family lysophospholipid transporter-like MFS transporter
MGSLLLLLAGVQEVWAAKLILIFIGISGGIVVVPLNASIQDIGHAGIGSGRAVAVQNLFQNSAILLSMGLYSAVAAQGIGSVPTLLVLGLTVFIMTAIVSVCLPAQPRRQRQ